MSTITTILADDHPLLVEGARQFLVSNRIKVLQTVANGNQAYKAIITHQPDLAILDFDMPDLNGLEVARLCKSKEIQVKIIILTLYKQEAIAKEIGRTIVGYILKEDALDELLDCISKITKGQTYISDHITERFYIADSNNPLASLTVSEIKILRHLARNQSSSQIAESLFISKRTVEKHRSNIIKKLGITPTQHGLLLWVNKNLSFFEK